MFSCRVAVISWNLHQITQMIRFARRLPYTINRPLHCTIKTTQLASSIYLSLSWYHMRMRSYNAFALLVVASIIVFAQLFSGSEGRQLSEAGEKTSMVIMPPPPVATSQINEHGDQVLKQDNAREQKLLVETKIENITVDNYRPTSPGHSPGIGH